MADNSTHHKVWLPGPHYPVSDVEVDEHPPTCVVPEPTLIDRALALLRIRPLPSCPVEVTLAEWVATNPYIAVEGYYFTLDGANFERCAWQPPRHR